tara:strand:- start:316 stop:945 length:630 start_codon:yes stop_codon:yes gene_type:complete
MEINLTNNSLESIISKSQRCQRNWDLSKQVTEEDLQTLKTAVTNCPSKQNVLFYKVIFVQNREMIEKIHESSDCFAYNFEPRKITTNPQILANTVAVFVRDRDFSLGPRTQSEWEKGIVQGKKDKDEYAAVGIAAGYLNLTAHMLGYKTGFYNSQWRQDTLSQMFGKEYIFCMLGIGYPDESKHRRDHHLNPDFRFPTLSKTVQVEEWK